MGDVHPLRVPLAAALVDGAEDREAVAKLRYDVYIREQRKAYREADHEAGLFEDELDDSGSVVLVRRQTRAVGTVRVNHFDDIGAYRKFREDFAIQRFGEPWSLRSLVTCTRLAVAADERGAEVCTRVFEEIYRYGLANDVRFCFAMCAPPLLALFKRYGFLEYLSPLAHRVIGTAHRLVLVLEDLEHFTTVRSPFLRIVAEPAKGRDAAAWFASTFPSVYPGSTGRRSGAETRAGCMQSSNAEIAHGPG